MKNGILSKTDGFDIIVNEVVRSFRDERAHAIAGGIFLKTRFPKDKVQIRVRADGMLLTVLDNGTLG